jgi:amino acid transporter
MVLGAGIFRSPSAVAAAVPDLGWLLGLWALGGLISAAGGLCYAELSAAFPHPGGDYHFLKLAYGRTLAFSFGWTRFLVVNTGSLAFLGFVLGDYCQAALPLGPQGPAIYAALSVAGLTAVNLSRLDAGVGAQSWLTGVLLLGLGLVIAAGLAAGASVGAAPSQQAEGGALRLGEAMVFILLAYGGWNEVSTLSADLRAGPRAMVRVLLGSLAVITVLYLLVNGAMAWGLGLSTLAQSDAPADAIVQQALGEAGLGLIGRGVIIAVVAAAVITSINATVIAGSRTTFAAAADWPQLSWLAGFDAGAGVARKAALAQCGVALALVVFGALDGSGFRALVDYTTPVYWFFLFCGGAAVLVLRRKLAHTPRPFVAPGGVFVPLLFMAASAFMFYSSVQYAGAGAILGLTVLLSGVLAALMLRKRGGQA